MSNRHQDPFLPLGSMGRAGVFVLTVLTVACTSGGGRVGTPSGAGIGIGPSSPDQTTQATSRPRAPAASGLRGLIAYGSNGNIWVMNADGSNRRQVTDAGGNDFDPSLSPDGKRIVFRSSRGRFHSDPNGTGAEGIWVVNVDGSNQHQIQPPSGGLFPDWSPAGSRIALSTLRANHTETIVTMNPDGSHIHDTGVTGGECSEWSPDGSEIMYCSLTDGQFDVWVMNADGSHQHRLTHALGNDYPGAWSPDGKQIAFGSQRGGSFDVFVMNADGTAQMRLTRSPDQEGPEAWLTDGRIVVSSFHGNEPLPSWYLMNADGTHVRSLPQLQGANDPLDWLSNGTRTPNAP